MLTPTQIAAILGPMIAERWPSLAVATDYGVQVLALAEKLAEALTVPPVRVEVGEIVVEDRRRD